ncbi:MAG: hypothetical protein H0T71_10840, partial [Acidobacteria bacterium]|nr:hypothetical protein [Acidobacteriota bacterium]
MRHRLEYMAVAFIRAALSVLPHALVRALGGMLGLMFYAVDRGHRRVASTNLAQAFPTRTPGEVG